MFRVASAVLVALTATQSIPAASLVRVADGDCGAFTSAAESTTPVRIVLARNGNYACGATVTSAITVNGEGASFYLFESPGVQFSIAASGSLTLQNINLGSPTSATASGDSAKFLQTYEPFIVNAGTLVLENASVSNVGLGSALTTIGQTPISNSGLIVMRNVTVTGNSAPIAFPMIGNTGSIDISQSTIANNSGFSTIVTDAGAGHASIANSILLSASSLCSGGGFMSLGGNLLSDSTCGSGADRIASDADFVDFGAHGGVVNTLSLGFGSPAVGIGVAANCEATDARGASRGVASCDAGAFEFGGGNGNLAASGMTGTFYNASGAGDYFIIERLDNDDLLVYWSTFDAKGVAHTLYGVGVINGNEVQFTQVADNLGGKLQSNGTVTGATPTLWGSFDLTFNSCASATLKYQSSQPNFGSATVNLSRLIYVGGLDCSP